MHAARNRQNTNILDQILERENRHEILPIKVEAKIDNNSSSKVLS